MKITMKARTNAPEEDVEALVLRAIQVRPEVEAAAAAEAAAQEEGTDQETAPETQEALALALAQAPLPPEMQRQAEAEAEEATTTTMMMMIQAQEEGEEVALQVIQEQGRQGQAESGLRGQNISMAQRISQCLGDCLPRWPPNPFIQKIYGKQHTRAF